MSLFRFVCAADEGGHRGERLRHPPDVDYLLAVAQTEVADDAVAPIPVGVVRRGALADHAKTVGVVHVHPGAVLARQPRELRQGRIVPGHRVDSVYGCYLPGSLSVKLEPTFQIVWIIVVEPVHGRTSRFGELGCLLHGSVGGPVQEDNAVGAREDGQHAAVEEGDGREHQYVRDPDKPRDLLLQILVDLRGGHGPGPARMRAPTPYRIDDRSQNLRVQVQAEVVGGREIGVPASSDLDVPAVLLAYNDAELRDLPEYLVLQPDETDGLRCDEPVRFRRLPRDCLTSVAHHGADVLHHPQLGDDRIAQLYLEGCLHLDQ